ncbi:hypothetical protein GUITHDRAFT_153570 [Guillardia theta CCMP2712]|uniref:Uncharacterized protein n=1 Tax=Guillardia theta (strain CCMP2712) TaxID=905079 RepID=L1J192_GUITC|nr:hypothetical protein GUITHDRAFT_153570 [Guillardia theta CCMP2712]EKX42283.1 hypothetical protein GUITHDRAFT_153570 [Guillardia theta CCMP2712]|eukprot:XP_005829263.1 hypothetical protein GUITHDRAFT_153570 [Guillardia theta CCMP2712]
MNSRSEQAGQPKLSNSSSHRPFDERNLERKISYILSLKHKDLVDKEIKDCTGHLLSLFNTTTGIVRLADLKQLLHDTCESSINLGASFLLQKRLQQREKEELQPQEALIAFRSSRTPDLFSSSQPSGMRARPRSAMAHTSFQATTEDPGREGAKSSMGTNQHRHDIQWRALW